MSLFYQKIGYAFVLIYFLFYVSLSETTQKDPQDPLCQEKKYQTLQTQCTITFSSCKNLAVDTFVKCYRKSCMRHLGVDSCQRSLDFQLSEKDCLWECCKSNVFSQIKCDDFNKELKQSRSTQDNLLILILIIIAGCLIIFTLFFFFQVLKCKENERHTLKQQNLHDPIQWVDCKYFDTKCDSCLGYGPMIFTPCNHSYHEHCYFQKIQSGSVICPQCPQKNIFSLKICCAECRQKYFKTKILNVSAFKAILKESKILHVNECTKGGKQAETDVRLTCSGSD